MGNCECSSNPLNCFDRKKDVLEIVKKVKEIEGSESRMRYRGFEGLKGSIMMKSGEKVKKKKKEEKSQWDIKLIQLIIQKGFCVEFMKAEKKISDIQFDQYESLFNKDIKKREKFNLKIYHKKSLDNKNLKFRSFEAKFLPKDFFDFSTHMSLPERQKIDSRITKHKILAKNIKSQTEYYLIHQQIEGNIFKKGLEILYITGLKKLENDIFLTIKFSVNLDSLVPRTGCYERIKIQEEYGVFTKDPMTGFSRYEEFSKIEGNLSESGELIKQFKRVKERKILEEFLTGMEDWRNKGKFDVREGASTDDEDQETAEDSF